MAGILEELETAAAAVAAAVGPATVDIGRDGRGAGIVVGDGHVLTNAHNVRSPQTTVTFGDGRVAAGELVGADVDGDLAVLAVPTGGAPAVPWADHPAALGAVVFAVAPGPGGPRISFGLISGTDRSFRGPRGRRIGGSLEHTAPLPRGSSGSAVVDTDGRLLGLNTNRLGDGFYLALPADAELRSRVDALVCGESPHRVVLGVGLAPAAVARRLRRSVGLPERDGLLVQEVDDAGPAGRAGVRRGDLLVEADGQAIVRADDLYQVLDRLQPDQPLSLLVVRGADELRMSVHFAAAAEAEESGDEGSA